MLIVRAAIFDMDGLLIDSEPLWREAEIDVFGSIGVSLTDESCRETTGLRLDEVVRYWHERFPWQGESLQTVEARVLEAVSRLIVERGRPMPGAREAISTLMAEDFKLAVASSSPLPLIHTVLQKFEMTENFDVLQSAEAEENGKPDPAVYLSAISRLGVSAEDCVAFEDSVAGVKAAKGAGTQVIAVPDAADFDNPDFSAADVVLASLTEFSMELVRRC